MSLLFCSIFLVYQFSQLSSQYMSGKTVVNIEVNRELYENLPAITLCLPQIFLLEKLAKYDQEYQNYYYNYDEMLSEENISNSTK